MILGRAAALLLDLDGVLVDSRAAIDASWRAWARRHGLDEAAVLRAAHGRRMRESIPMVAPHLDPAEEEARLVEREATDLEGVRAFPGAVELVETLPAGRWAVVTSCALRVARARMDHVGLARPEVLVTAESVAHGKPHPDPYAAGAAGLGVAAGACWAVEDAPAGIASARAARVRVIAVSTTHPPSALGEAEHLLEGGLDRLRVTAEGEGLVLSVEA